MSPPPCCKGQMSCIYIYIYVYAFETKKGCGGEKISDCEGNFLNFPLKNFFFFRGQGFYSKPFFGYVRYKNLSLSLKLNHERSLELQYFFIYFLLF